MRGYWDGRSSTVARATVVLTLVLVTLLLPDSLVAPPHVVASVPAGGASPAGSGTKTTGPSVRALDGATLDTTIDGQQVAVHLVGIDVPQGNTPCGLLATRLLQTLVRGGLLQLEEDRKIAFTDKNSKKGVNLRVYDARLKDGRSLTQELVKAGVASVDDAEGEDIHHHDDDQMMAQTTHTGCLWGGAVPGLPPAPAGRLAPTAAHAVTGGQGRRSPPPPMPRLPLPPPLPPPRATRPTSPRKRWPPTSPCPRASPGTVRVLKGGGGAAHACD